MGFRKRDENGKAWEREIRVAMDAERITGRSCIYQSPASYGRRTAAGTFVPVKQPVDFFGCWRGRAVAFDAKSMEKGWRFTFTSRVGDHQREMLIGLGRAGAIAGLLVEVRDRKEAYWVSWWNLTGSGVDLADCPIVPMAPAWIDWERLLNDCRIPAAVLEGGGSDSQIRRMVVQVNGNRGER